jgi:predicted nuclease of predicted toxin-antitoxin system
MQVKLLLDENLSPTVGAKLRQDGFDVVHVRDRKLSGRSDREILDKAYAEDRVFRKLADARELHPGIVLVVDGDLLRAEQEEVVRRALAALRNEHEAGRDLMNRALYIGREAGWKFEERHRRPKAP